MDWTNKFRMNQVSFEYRIKNMMKQPKNKIEFFEMWFAVFFLYWMLKNNP